MRNFAHLIRWLTQGLLGLGFLVVGNSSLLGQAGIRLGYAGAFVQLRETNRLIYVYNLKPGFDKPMDHVRMMHGLSVTFYKAIDDDIRWEIRWQNRHRITASEITTAGEHYRREIKIRQNCLSGGYYFGNPVYLGLSLDVGHWKGFTRASLVDSIADTPWTRIFTFSGGSPEFYKSGQVAMTLHAGVEYGFIGARIFWQIQFIKRALDDMDNVLLGMDIEQGNWLRDRSSNLGLELYLKIGK